MVRLCAKAQAQAQAIPAVAEKEENQVPHIFSNAEGSELTPERLAQANAMIQNQKPAKLSEPGVQLLKSIESLRLKPYDDQTGQTISHYVQGATIGYGYLIPKNQWSIYQSGITQAQADALFAKSLSPFERIVASSVHKPLKQQEFDALVILCYNIGSGNFRSSSVLKILNGGTSDTYKRNLDAAWMSWVKSQGDIMIGLKNRRNAELQIYYQGIYKKW